MNLRMRVRRALLLAAIAAAVGRGVAGGNFYTPGETVELGGKTWMRKNLNVETADSWCYGNSPDSCAKYGRLYTWEAAKAACKSLGGGWRLPSQADWDSLVRYVGGKKDCDNESDCHYWYPAGDELKSTRGWNSYGHGKDKFVFSALPGGYRSCVDGGFRHVGYIGIWWTATENDSGYAYGRNMNYHYNYLYENSSNVNLGFSVRCVKN